VALESASLVVKESVFDTIARLSRRGWFIRLLFHSQSKDHNNNNNNNNNNSNNNNINYNINASPILIGC
jgi:hypothetical protein